MSQRKSTSSLVEPYHDAATLDTTPPGPAPPHALTSSRMHAPAHPPARSFVPDPSTYDYPFCTLPAPTLGGPTPQPPYAPSPLTLFPGLRAIHLIATSDKPVMFGSIVSAAYADHTLLPPGKYITIFQYLEYPASRGKPDFDRDFMNDKADFAPFRPDPLELQEDSSTFRGELTSHHPRFHPASPAEAKDLDIQTARGILPNEFTVDIHMGTWQAPGETYNAANVHEDIKYTEEDNKAIDDWIADHVETTWHSLGTCAMKPREEGGVVDGRLNVFGNSPTIPNDYFLFTRIRGTENLKCVDLSICPDNLTKTYSSALLVGEKGASLLAEDLGLKIKTPHAPVPHAPVPKGMPATHQVR
ncbi:hypothetical protein B0H14DRAFT_3505858 [Mycena olivaceomarginata]|nr:hypothetical protein B0H14DRAFT_3505858 [Mycena olivaceomarginata]